MVSFPLQVALTCFLLSAAPLPCHLRGTKEEQDQSPYPRAAFGGSAPDGQSIDAQYAPSQGLYPQAAYGQSAYPQATYPQGAYSQAAGVQNPYAQLAYDQASQFAYGPQQSVGQSPYAQPAYSQASQFAYGPQQSVGGAYAGPYGGQAPQGYGQAAQYGQSFYAQSASSQMPATAVQSQYDQAAYRGAQAQSAQEALMALVVPPSAEKREGWKNFTSFLKRTGEGVVQKVNKTARDLTPTAKLMHSAFKKANASVSDKITKGRAERAAWNATGNETTNFTSTFRKKLNRLGSKTLSNVEASLLIAAGLDGLMPAKSTLEKVTYKTMAIGGFWMDPTHWLTSTDGYLRFRELFKTPENPDASSHNFR